MTRCGIPVGEGRRHRLDGNEVVLEGEGLLAQALQHETDHLDGKLYLDRLAARDAARRDAGDPRVRLVLRPTRGPSTGYESETFVVLTGTV